MAHPPWQTPVSRSVAVALLLVAAGRLSLAEQTADNHTSGAAALLEWVRDAGGWLDEARVGILESAKFGDEPGGRGLYSLRPVEEGCLLAWMPESHFFTQYSNPEIHQRAQSLAWPPDISEDENYELIVSFATVAAALAVEVRRGPQSTFHAYIETMPKDCPQNFATAPAELRAWLHASPLASLARFLEAALWGLGRLAEWLGLSPDEEQWAGCTTTSRVFTHHRLGVAFYPLLELTNHGFSSRTTFSAAVTHRPGGCDVSAEESDGDSERPGHLWVDLVPGAGIVASRDLAIGDEVAFSYGERSNADLAMVYDFVMPGAAALHPVVVPVGGLAQAACGEAERTEDGQPGSSVALPRELSPSALRVALGCLLGPEEASPAEERREGSAPMWSTKDLPVLKATSEACGDLGRRWAESLEAAPSDLGQAYPRLFGAALEEQRHLEECAWTSSAVAAHLERRLARRAALRR